MNNNRKLGGGFVILVLAGVAAAILASRPARANGPWYVTTTGNDANDCLSPATPCGTINGAIGKATSGDTIYVATGTYTSSIGSEVVLIDKDITLSGGWDASFTNQYASSIIDGVGQRKGIRVDDNKNSIVEKFTIQNGRSYNYGGGIEVGSTATLNLIKSAVNSNGVASGSWGGGIFAGYYSKLILTNSVVSKNTSSDGGGIYSWSGSIEIRNSVIHGNSAIYGGGVYSYFGAVSILSSTIAFNTATANGGGISGYGSGTPVSVNISNSALVNNRADCGGGSGLMGNHSLLVTNSTLSGNEARLGGGLCNSATLINATIAENTASEVGGGVYSQLSLGVSMQNSILAQNTAGINSDDCSGPLHSLGYDFIQSTDGCLIDGDTTNNITGIPSKLFPPIASPLFYPLQYDSPAIDAGDPAGCKDSLGVPLSTDQRGTTRTLDSNGDGSIRCDIGAYEYDPSHPITISQVFLPSIAHNYCPDFFDDFSNPASGWSVRDDAFVRSEYLNGEYRTLSKQSGYFYFFTSPGCERQNYVVETDARWEGAPGDSYGLRFGITSDFSQYYLFDMNTDYQLFRVLRRSPSGWATVVPVTASGAIHTGSTSNHLKVTRNGSQITLEVNGMVLGTWYDATIGGFAKTGLMFSPLDANPAADARFDNFRVSSLPSSAIVVSPPPSQAAVVAPVSTDKLDERPTLKWLIPSPLPEVNQQ